MKVSAANTNRFFGIGPDSVLYLNLSPDYIAGKMMIVRALEANAQLIEETPSNDVLANYNGSGIDLAAFVPSQLVGLLHNPEPAALPVCKCASEIPHFAHSQN